MTERWTSLSFLETAWFLVLFIVLFLPVGFMIAILLFGIIPLLLLTMLLAMPFTWAAYKLGIIKKNPITVTYHYKDRFVIHKSDDKQ